MILKRILILTVIITSAFLFSYSFINAETAPANYGFDVAINPDAAQSGVFQAKFVISELSSGKVVASPTIRFRAGESADATAGTGNGVNFKFSVSVDEKGSVAEYSAAVLDSTTEISHSQARILLKN
jgi:hypothetical protein